MSELPEGWEKSHLSKLCSRIVDGSHNPPQAAEVGKPMLSARNIQRRTILFDDFRFISEVDFALEQRRTQIATNDVLLTIVGTIGRVAVVKNDTPEFALQRSVAVLRPGLAIAPQYLGYVLESPRVQQHFIDTAKGTAQKGVYLKALGELEVELAPLAEQTRIANQLDTLLARVQACNDRFDAIPALLKRFRQTVTNAACSGELSAEWRGTSDLKGWKSQALANVCSSITDGDHQAPPQADSGVPFITISAMNDGRLRLEKASRFVPQSYFDNLKPTRRPARGDLLYSVTGSIGIPAQVDTDEPFTFQRHIAILKPNKSLILSSFIALALGSEATRTQVMEVATGTAQLTIPLSGIRAFVLNLPPLDEQAEIIRRVEALFALADRIEARCTIARAQAQRLTPLVLAKAFRGELVPQDPNDEPASALLERIGSINTVGAGKSKRKVPIARKEHAWKAINL